MTLPSASPLSTTLNQRAGDTVTTTDVWKFIGLFLITIDHIGLYFFPDEVGLRMFGRISIPIWFFLIGFGKPGLPPRLWLVFGIGLTALELIIDGYDENFRLNILLNYALVRLLIWLVLAKPDHAALQNIPLTGRVLCLAGLGWLLFPLSHSWVEYGSLAWGFAIAGFVHARSQAGDKSYQKLMIALMVITTCAFAWTEIMDFSFSAPQKWALFTGLLIVGINLMLFKRRILAIRLPRYCHETLKISGTFSLEIYAAQLFVFSLLGMVFK